MGLNQFSEGLALNNQVRFTNADGTTLKSVMTQSGYPSRLDSLLVSNTDTIAHVIRFYWNWAGTDYLIGSINVPAGAGTAGVAAVEAMSLLFPSGSQGFTGTSGWNLRASMEVAVVATFNVDMVAFAGTL